MYQRRTILKGALATPALLLAGFDTSAQTLTGDVGVASGEPRPDGVLLWTRVPEAFQGGAPVTVNWSVSTDESFTTIAAAGSLTVDASTDYTVKVRVRGLAPFTRYFYRFTTPTGYTSVTGRTRTAPAPNSEPAAITFAYVSCQDYTQGFYTVFAAMAADSEIDFCIHLGDNIYETGAAGFQNGQVREDTIGGGESLTLDEYRQKYKLYLSDPNFREVRRLYPWINLWDDHEVFNNYAGTTLDAAGNSRQLAGYQAFIEYMPVEPVTPLAVDASGKPSVRLYRRIGFGKLADLFVLDLRQYRNGLACETDFLSFGCDALDDPRRTMLGYQQRGWLKNNLQASTARWKVLLNEMMFQRFVAFDFELFGVTGRKPRFFSKPLAIGRSQNPQLFDVTLYINLDAWDGYPAERQDLLSFIGSQNIKNVVVWTGDIHNCYAGVLKPDFTDPASPAVAVEVVGGSVSSAGVFELTGSFIDLTGLTVPLLQAENPHIEYVDLRYHVYTKATLTPTAMTVRYQAVETIVNTTSPVFTLRTFTIPDGQPVLQQS